MYKFSSTASLTGDQCLQLDDTFLESDPFAYINAKISMLLFWAERSTSESLTLTSEEDDSKKESTISEHFLQFIGQGSDFLPKCTPETIATQVATDAFSLRHHTAETLVRFTAALLSHEYDGKSSLWETLSNGDFKTEDVIKKIRRAGILTEGSREFSNLVLLPTDAAHHEESPLKSTCSVFLSWLSYAIHLLEHTEIPLNVVNNKIKHGLAVRMRDDYRLSLTTKPPNSDGNIPVSAFSQGNCIDILSDQTIEIVAKAPKEGNSKRPLEITQLKVDIPRTLAETFMISWTYAAMFNVASVRHFHKRMNTDANRKIAKHPSYPVGGPFPSHIIEKKAFGIRVPLTSPPGEETLLRPLGAGGHTYFIPLVLHDREPRNARIVADENLGI